MKQLLSAEYPKPSKYIDILGSQLHYIEQGEGDPVLFLHGIPTSCYLWRNIMPYLNESARVIAVDLIGLGQSDKPNIDYTINEHIRYISAFIEELKLKNITLVLHAWGAVIGFTIAMRYPELFKGLAFLESQIRPVVDSSMLSLPMHEITSMVANHESDADVRNNPTYYVDKILPAGVLRRLTDEEMQHYRAPFLETGSDKPIWQFLMDLPKGNEPTAVTELILDYSNKLQQSSLPKLMMYAIPGFNTTMSTVTWAKDHLPNLTQVDIGDGLHYPQESNPEAIGEALSRWYHQLS